jgi:signal peptidase II
MTDEAPPNAPSDEDLPGEPHPPVGPSAAGLEEDKPEADAAKPAEVEAPVAAPPIAPVPATPAWRPNYLFLAGVSVASLILDLGTKWWAETRLHTVRTWPETRVDVIKDHVGFMFRKNDGGAWGLLSTEPASVRRPFFLGISVVAIIFIVSLYRKLTPRQWALKWGLPLVLGGALGNLVNRIQYNYVVDFIDVSARWDGAEHHWPTFNVADIAIVVGVLLMAVDMFTPSSSRTPATAVKPGAPTTDPKAPSEPVQPVTMGVPPKPAAPKET